MDHHPAHQDPCIEQRSPHGDCQGGDREVQGLAGGDLVFPMPSNSVCNTHLKQIAKACGIHKEIGFHLSRHTFATTVYLCNGGTIEALSKILGHKYISTTRIYAEVTNRMVAPISGQSPATSPPCSGACWRRRTGNRTGSGCALPPGNGLTPFPGAECGKGRNFRCGVPAFAAFPDAHPRAFMLDFSPFALWAHVHVVLLQHTQRIRLAVERLARQRYVRDQPLRAVVLQRSRRDVQQPAHVLAREIDLAIHRWAEVRRHRVKVPHAFLQCLEVRPYLFRVPCDRFHLTRPPSFPGSWLPRTPPRPLSGSKSCG